MMLFSLVRCRGGAVRRIVFSIFESESKYLDIFFPAGGSS